MFVAQKVAEILIARQNYLYTPRTIEIEVKRKEGRPFDCSNVLKLHGGQKKLISIINTSRSSNQHLSQLVSQLGLTNQLLAQIGLTNQLHSQLKVAAQNNTNVPQEMATKQILKLPFLFTSISMMAMCLASTRSEMVNYSNAS